MNNIKDRRSFDRLTYPHMTSYLVNAKWLSCLQYRIFYILASMLPVKALLQNISASGFCILSHYRLKRGDAIHLILSVPGRKNIFIKGTVSWISASGDTDSYFVGGQFQAFGRGKKYNSYDILEQLHQYSIQNQVTDEQAG